MKDVIHKIFLKEFDEDVHSSLVKFSRGDFANRYLIEAKKQKERWLIKTSAEYGNYLVRTCLEKSSNEVEVTGVIVATFNIQDKAQFPIERIKQFMGVKQAVVNTKVSPDKIISLMNEFPKAFYALSFKTDNYELKVKSKAPKSAKPPTKGDKEVSADFCTLKTSDGSIIKDMLFEISNFKEANVKHIIQINEIILPEGIEDPAELREKAKRRGVVIRTLKIDGKEIKSETEFEA
ncbi:hypothetical protein HYW75_02915 [Candidatus Pacearchaeota archaeon]|nr:hypothetical protein [Candidatus Pacearchaeota archaeon]